MMATRKAAPPANQAVTPEHSDRPVTPTAMFSSGADHSFTLQTIMELQKSVGEMNANLQAVKGSVDSIKGKVEDLVSWKHMILGGAAVCSVMFAAIVFIVTKASDYIMVKPNAPAVVTVSPVQPTAPAVASVPAVPAKRP